MPTSSEVPGKERWNGTDKSLGIAGPRKTPLMRLRPVPHRRFGFAAVKVAVQSVAKRRRPSFPADGITLPFSRQAVADSMSAFGGRKMLSPSAADTAILHRRSVQMVTFRSSLDFFTRRTPIFHAYPLPLPSDGAGGENETGRVVAGRFALSRETDSHFTFHHANVNFSGGPYSTVNKTVPIAK